MNGQNEKNDYEENIKQELAADGNPSGVEEEMYSPYPFDAEKISISSKKISLSNVVRRLNRGLIRAAEIQRGQDLWDIGRKSRLIESLMLKIPLPLFYAAADKNDELVIVDGLQRISAIKNYVTEERGGAKEGKGFKLESLEFLRGLSGKKYVDLPENMRIRIDETELDFVIISPDSPPEVQRNIFKRLNTGGLPLTEQEIRNALYFGPATKLLKELADTEEFQNAVARGVNDSRMAAQELVLRFLSFSIMGVGGYEKNDEMDSFLSDAMRIINKLSADPGHDELDSLFGRKVKNKDIRAIRDAFISAMRKSALLFDNCAFRISTPLKIRSGAIRTPINKSLFEVWSVLLSNMPDSEFDVLLKKREMLFKKLDDEFKDKESYLRRFISPDSSKVSGVRGRHEIIRRIVEDILKGAER